jgi:hypothetical protein
MQQDSNHPTGVSGEDKTPGVIRARERKANAALQLKLAGASWFEIADIVGYPTERAALVAVEGALERELRDDDMSKAKMRDIAGRRLERLLRSAWGKAVDPKHPEHLAAIGKAKEVVDRHAKLYGLDAPTEVVVHSPSQSELDAWVARIVNSDVPALEEGNIFDAEIVEEDGDEETA